MEKAKYEVGTIVKLKSGGPEMTIQKATHDMQRGFSGSYRCQWFAGKKSEADVFPEESLKVVDPAPKSE